MLLQSSSATDGYWMLLDQGFGPLIQAPYGAAAEDGS